MSPLNDWCCGCSQQTITKAIGFLNLLGWLFSLIYTSVSISTIEDVSIRIITLILIVAMIGNTISLLISAYQNERPMRLLPWLVMEFIVVMLRTGGLLCLGVDIAMDSQEDSEIEMKATACIFGAIIYAGVKFYLWFVVLSYYKTLKVKMERVLHPI